jgi:hypothetical protein
MIDRPHVDDIVEVGEGTFDFGKFFVEAYRVDCGQIGLFGLNSEPGGWLSGSDRPLRWPTEGMPSVGALLLQGRGFEHHPPAARGVRTTVAWNAGVGSAFGWCGPPASPSKPPSPQLGPLALAALGAGAFLGPEIVCRRRAGCVFPAGGYSAASPTPSRTGGAPAMVWNGFHGRNWGGPLASDTVSLAAVRTVLIRASDSNPAS